MAALLRNGFSIVQSNPRGQILIYKRQHDWIDTLKPAWTRGLLMTSITLVSMILDASEREDLWHPG